MAKTVKDVVQFEMYQAVAEVVMGIRTLKGSQQWTPDEIEQGWSPEALTAATMVRFHMLNAIKRTLGSRLGKIAA